MITVYCDSLQGFYDCEPGMTVGELSRKIDTGCGYPVVAALVDNMLKELTFPIYTPHTIKFLDCTHPDGRRTYSRSLSFVLQKAAVDMFPDLHLFLDGRGTEKTDGRAYPGRSAVRKDKDDQ